MKKIIFTFLMITLVMSSNVFAITFSDLSQNHWAYRSIQKMANMGILKGYPDGTFQPNGAITRAEFAKILVLTLDLKNSAGVCVYDDVDTSHWAYDYIATADDYYSGYYQNGKWAFLPEKSAIREDVAIAVVNAVGFENEEYDLKILNRFSDKSDISKDVQKYVAIAVEKHLMQGNADGTFNPRGTLTRAEVTQLMLNALEVIEESVVSDVPVAPNEQTPTPVVSDAPVAPNEQTEEFETSFLKRNDTKKNLIYSPLSIKYALRMLEDGANGNTRNEIDSVVGNLNLTKYDNIPDKLSLANAIYINQRYQNDIKGSYTTQLKNAYQAEVKIDPFTSPNPMNDWISEKTFGLIQNVLDSDTVNPDETLLLINALAIQMEWQRKFENDATRKQTFTKVDGSTMDVSMMSRKAAEMTDTYWLDNDITAVCMNLKQYGDTQLEFIAVMPKNQSLSEYTKTISMKELEKLTQKMIIPNDPDTEVKIKIPKFKYDFSLEEFKQNLIDLGIKEVFVPDRANLTNIAELEDNLYVNAAIHKAMIDFSEEGIKAAAVTVFGVKANSIFMPPKTVVDIVFDQPFFYVIRDKQTKEIWFVGTVYEPTLWKNS